MRDDILEEISRLTALGLKRTLRLIEGPQGPKVMMDGREVVLMCSNDYLGLANHPLVKEAAISAVERWGAGAGASRLVSVNMEPHVNGGVFPMNRVYEVIDGRTDDKAHGGRAMPVWGRDYSIKGAEYDLEVQYQPESYVRGKILSLIDYIYRMQVK